MFSFWRHGATALLAIVAALGFAGCEGCEPEPPPAEGCAAYCTNVMAGCTGDNQLYADEAACLAACALFPATGADGDAEGDTLQCRLFHSTAVAEDTVHCAHASAQGGGVCGTNCDVYCRYMTTNCGDGFGTDVPSCLATCSAYPIDGAINAADGNTVQCRTFHAQAAADDAATHCPHAGITGGGACGADACEAYCDQVQANCRDSNQLYPDRDACMATCGNMPAEGAWDASDGNSVQCRAYHGAGAAKVDATHCAHASANGGTACGTYCEGYCDQVMGNCTGGNAQFTDAAACATTCAGYPVGSNFAIGGDSVQCRTFHGSYPAAEDPTTHCPHAGEASVGVCEDPAPPAQEVDISGAVHELASHLNGTHTGVVGANVVAYGATGVTPATTTAGGNYTLTDVPANGQVILAVTAAGNQATYQAVSVGSTDITGQGLVVAGGTWMDSVNAQYLGGVNPTTQFTCQYDATKQCLYSVVVGQILDGAGAPVAGMSAGDITVKGGDNTVDWRKMGPYFLNANGSAGNNSTSQSGGLFVVYVEMPAAATDPASMHIELAARTGTGDTAKYYGPTHTAAYRGTPAVTWANLLETGNVPPGVGTIAFDGQIYPLFLPTADGGYGCQGCHTNQGGATPAGGFNLWGGADVAYASLDPANHPTRVNLATPASSTLLTKPLYPANEHPLFAWASANDAAYKLIIKWIEEGANRFAAGSRVSFVAQVKPLLGEGTNAIGCATCHAGAASAGLQLDGTAQEMYNELTVEAAQDGGTTGETRRVNQQNYPERSLILTKPLTGHAATHSPKIFLSTADPRYQLLYRWISEGAQYDGYCDDYCDAMTDNCTDTGHIGYTTREQCITACGAMPQGNITDQTGDTAYCRLFHASAANNDGHCWHGGYTGGGMCGGYCETYCRGIQNVCTGAVEQYADAAACQTACTGFAATGTVGDAAGNTVQCRLYHLQAAAVGDSGDVTDHCPHAGATSTTCVD